MVKKLKPIHDKLKYSRSIDKTIWKWWQKSFWTPLLNLFNKELYNDNESIIIQALRDGKIRYINGEFVGKFNAKLSKALQDLGAIYNKRRGSYVIDRMLLSAEIVQAIALAEMAAGALRVAVLQFINNFKLEDYLDDLSQLLQISLDDVYDDLDEQTIKTLQDDITVEPVFSKQERQRLNEKYINDVSKSIKNFTNEQINKLRQMVEKNYFYKNSDEALIKQIMKEFNVSKNKAKFLARQETSLLVAEYRKIRYERVGIKRYQWSTSHDDRVRQKHKELDKKVCYFDDPPVTNEKGDHNNPGEDWQCRCIPIPIFEGE